VGQTPFRVGPGPGICRRWGVTAVNEEAAQSDHLCVRVGVGGAGEGVKVSKELEVSKVAVY